MTTITGNDTAQTLYGTAAADLIKGMGGNDVIYGKAGNDKIYGGTGADTLYGDAGTDWLYGEAGDDVLNGGTGISYLDGGIGNDTLIYAPTTADISAFGSYFSASMLKGGDGNDTLRIDNTATASGIATRTDVSILEDGTGYIEFHDPRESGDYRNAGTFSSIEALILTGRGGADYYASFGGAGPKTVTGTASIDNFHGGNASETFIGGAGNDTFYASGGTDRWTGGAGVDTFIIDSPQGDVVITDFEGAGKAGGDRLAFTHEGLHSPASQIKYVNGHTIIDMGQGNTIDVAGIINSNDYIFVS